MIVKKLAYGLAAASFISSPVTAYAEGAERASQPASQESRLSGGNFVPIAIMVAVLAAGVWLVVDDDDDDEPVSA